MQAKTGTQAETKNQPDPGHYEEQKRAGTDYASRVATTGRILRSFGGVALIAAACTMLLQFWGTSTDVVRYLALLGMTVALPAIGLACGIGLREGRGARTMFGLMLTLLPVHFALLGGIVYSQWIPSDAAAQLPQFAVWGTSSPWIAAAVTAGAISLLAPLGFFAFTVLARGRRRVLTCVYLVANGALLIPTREPWMIAVIAVGLAGAWLAAELLRLRNSVAMQTLDGIWVRALLPVPLILLVARQVSLYGYAHLLAAVMWAAVAGAILVLAPAFGNKIKTMAQRIAAVPVILSWSSVYALIVGDLSLGPAGQSLAYGVPLAAMLGAAAVSIESARRFYRRAAFAVAGVSVTVAMAFDATPYATIFCIAVATVYVAYGYVNERHALTAVGVLAAVSALGVHLWSAMWSSPWFGWAGLAGLGIAIIVGASMLERWSRSRVPA